MHLRVEFVLEDVQVVGGSDGDDVLGRVPGCVEDLLGEVQTVHTDVVLPALSSGGADPPRFKDGSGFAAFSGGFKGHVTFGVPVKHAEEVVVGAGHDHAVRAVPGTLKLVKDAVVFVKGAQLAAEVIMNLVCLQGLALHVEVPDFGSQVVSGEQVATAVAELDIRHRRDNLGEEGASAGVLGLLEQFGVFVTQR